MNQRLNIAYHEVDFLLPVHRFDIRFSFVTKKGLPFVREFLLRLVHVSPMMSADIAAYFGFTKREVDEAINDLVDKGDIQFTENGHVELTSKSKGYFVGLGSTPLVSSLLESGGAFAFELASFNCVGRKRTNERWMSGLRLEVSNETVANSERIAKRKFQEKFHDIQEQGFWEHKSADDAPGRPSIYTMESVRKLGQEPLRLTTLFTIDQDGIPVEREDFESLGDSSEVQELVTNAIAFTQKPTNIKQIAKAMAALGDKDTKKLFNEHSIDITKLMVCQQSGQLDDGNWIPFVGPIYAKSNWKLISDYLDKRLDIVKKNNDHPLDLVWLAPSDGFWGQSPRTAACFDELADRSATKGKKPRQLYNTKAYLPVHDSNDRRSINRWKQEFSTRSAETFGLVEGFLDGNVEVLILPDNLLVVCYHISRPESIPVTLPVGFLTTDKQKVNAVASLVKEYIEGVIAFDNPRDLGPLNKL